MKIYAFFTILFILFKSITGLADKLDEKAAHLRTDRWNKVMSGKIKPQLKPLDDAFPSSLGVTLELSSIEDVRKKLGDTILVFAGDSGTWTEKSLCYSAKDGSIVQFISDTMDGGKIGSVEVFKNKSDFVTKCSPSPTLLSPIVTKRGIQIGLSRSEAKRIFGVPSKSDPNYEYYKYEQNDSKGCTRYQEIYLHFSDEKVDDFALLQNGVC